MKAGKPVVHWQFFAWWFKAGGTGLTQQLDSAKAGVSEGEYLVYSDDRDHYGEKPETADVRGSFSAQITASAVSLREMRLSDSVVGFL